MQRPLGITILAIFAFVLAVLCLVMAAGVFMGVAGLIGLFTNLAGSNGPLAGLAGALGIGMLLVAVLYAALGFGLWKLHKWGRILCLIVVALGLLSSVAGLFSALAPVSAVLLVRALVVIAIDLWIITYLLKPHVQQAFGVQKGI